VNFAALGLLGTAFDWKSAGRLSANVVNFRFFSPFAIGSGGLDVSN
jgi:hypothetical protein